MDVTPKTDRNLAGYCGLYCGSCDIYRLHQDGIEASRTPEWTELPERLRKHVPFIKPSPIRCQGCRSNDVFSGCAHCPLRSCAKKKGNVELCVDCGSYPCIKTRLLQIFGWLFSIEKKLPHQKTKKTNLERILTIGIARWLSEQDQKWRCPDCQTRFSWYQKTCSKCGKYLDPLKGYFS